VYRKILAATDGSAVASRVAEHAAALAKATGGELTFVTVTEQAPTFAAAEIGWSVPSSVYDDIRRANVDRSRAILAAAVKRSGLAARTVHVEDQRPYEGILAAAEQIDADLVVIGSHGHRGLQLLLLGSQAAKVVTLAKVPVLVIK